MRGPLDDPAQGPRDYDRPNARWSCGLESEGCPCSAGPSPRGKCPALAECTPLRDGDRWVCNRSPTRGGPCDEDSPGGGPTPDGQCCLTKRCRPRRALRTIRGAWARGAVVFSVGAALMLLGAPSRNDLAKPGPLSSHHAQVLVSAPGGARCAACHPGADDSVDRLATAAAFGRSTDQPTQSQACLDCHQDLAAADAAPLLAHGLPTGAFGDAGRVRAAGFAGLLGAAPRGADHGDPVACSVCHQEHHGAGHDLAAMTDARCQACHTEQYDRFAGSHPDFGVWPYERRTGIAFNHASHQGTHFAKANAPFDCAACHLRDATGDLTARPTYQQACAACHEDDLRRSFGDGLDLVALPSIDRTSLAERQADPEAWPDIATGDFDGDIPPLMRLLLASDDEATAALETLGPDATFFDIDAGDEVSVEAGAGLITAVRSLLDELQEEGHAALDYRVRTLVGERRRPVDAYVGRLPLELIDELQAVWFGDREPGEPYDAIEDRRTGGGWRLDHERLRLGYRPTGHDDPLVRAWIDLAVALPDEHAAVRDVVLAELRRPGAPGGCFECHSLEETPVGFVVNWRGRDRLAEPRGFTHFSHRPHLSQPQLADCTHCHQIEEASVPSPGYVGLDPTAFASEFAPLAKSACTECHRPHAAGDACTQCHHYHVSPLSQSLAAEKAKETGKRTASKSDPRSQQPPR